MPIDTSIGAIIVPTCRPVVTTILESEQWRQALQFCCYDDPKSPETPLRKLIKKMPGKNSINSAYLYYTDQFKDLAICI